MIQRIQTVYLFLVAVLMVVSMALPVGDFYNDAGVWEMTNLHYTLVDGTLSLKPCVLFFLLVVVAALSLAAIFLYKKRRLQIRLAITGTFLLVAYYVAAACLIIFADGQDDSGFAPSWSLCLPLVSIILNWLAIRGINRDEMLVRSYDRIR